MAGLPVKHPVRQRLAQQRPGESVALKPYSALFLSYGTGCCCAATPWSWSALPLNSGEGLLAVSRAALAAMQDFSGEVAQAC